MSVVIERTVDNFEAKSARRQKTGRRRKKPTTDGQRRPTIAGTRIAKAKIQGSGKVAPARAATSGGQAAAPKTRTATTAPTADTPSRTRKARANVNRIFVDVRVLPRAKQSVPCEVQ